MPRGPWRTMTAADLDTVVAIAATVHPSFPERREVFAERLALAPEGALILEARGTPAGYAITHPARRFEPPALDTMLGTLTEHPDVWYIHDVALLPSARGQGGASRIAAIVAGEARRAGLERLALIAVNGSAPFWARQGFGRIEHPALAGKLASYGDDAVYMERLA
jgi:ribosomal protein S18 acetylase RimI-like enzyme